eukprot:821390-Lingulodinium_polyedra.AAC.1
MAWWKREAPRTEWSMRRWMPWNQCSGESRATTCPSLHDRPILVGRAHTISLRFPHRSPWN